MSTQLHFLENGGEQSRGPAVGHAAIDESDPELLGFIEGGEGARLGVGHLRGILGHAGLAWGETRRRFSE